MHDKAKHFLACFTLALIGFTQSIFAGLYGSALCAFLREYDRYAYTGKQDKKDMIGDLLADAFGIATAFLLVMACRAVFGR